MVVSGKGIIRQITENTIRREGKGTNRSCKAPTRSKEESTANNGSSFEVLAT